MIRFYDVTGETDGSGDAVVTTEHPILGELLAVVVDGTALTNGADLTLVGQMPAQDGADDATETYINNGDVGNATPDTFYPRRAAETNDGTDLVYASTDIVPVPYVIPGLLVKATVANGGATKGFRVRLVVRTD